MDDPESEFECVPVSLTAEEVHDLLVNASVKYIV